MGVHVESCKNWLGRRLKANVARWRVARVNRIASLCILTDSDQWAPDWQAAETPQNRDRLLHPKMLRGIDNTWYW